MFLSKISCVGFIVLANVLCALGYDITLALDDSWKAARYIDAVRREIVNKELVAYNTRYAHEIHDFILVTFNDPEIKLIVRTSNITEFQEAVKAVKPHSDTLNHSCPQPVLSGIKLALKESRPGSIVTVFTDASANDYDKFNDIKRLCNSKTIQVNLLLTGDCNDSSSRNYTVYEDVLKACTGHEPEPHIEKRDVRNVLNNNLPSMKLKLTK